MAVEFEVFSLFSLLPAELRFEIWRQSCAARVVEVRYAEHYDRCVSTTKPPVILQTCRESRYEGLRLYSKCFGTSSRPGDIYFASSFDILYIPRCGQMGYGDTARDFAQYVVDTVDHVHSLAIDHVQPEVRRPWETYNKFCLMRNFPLLKDAFLIFASASDDEGACEGDGQIEFVDPRADQEHIMKLMEDVTESFSYEVGYDIRPTTPKVEEKEDGEGDHCGQPHVALIPKTKTIWHQEHVTVSCI